MAMACTNLTLLMKVTPCSVATISAGVVLHARWLCTAAGTRFNFAIRLEVKRAAAVKQVWQQPSSLATRETKYECSWMGQVKVLMRPIYLHNNANSVPASQKTHTTLTKVNWLMVFISINVVYCPFREDRKLKILNIEGGGVYSYHGVLKASVTTDLTPDKGLCLSLIFHRGGP